MTRERYETLSAAVLKDLAKARHIKGFYAMKKEQLIEAMLAKDAEEEAAAGSGKAAEDPQPAAPKAERGKAKAPRAEHKKAEEKKAEAPKEEDAGAAAPKAVSPEPAAAPEAAAQADRTEKNTSGRRSYGKTGRTGRPAKAAQSARGKDKPAAAVTADTPAAPQGGEADAGAAEAQASGSADGASTAVSAGEARTPVRRGRTPRTERPVKPEGQPERKETRRRGRPPKDKGAQGKEPVPAEEAAAAADTASQEQTKAAVQSAPQETPQAEASQAAQAVLPAEAAGSEPAPEAAKAAPQDAAKVAPENVKEGAKEASDYVRPHREPEKVRGILEVMPDNYGFIRSDNFLPGDNDIYVSPSQIRRFNLKTGDMIVGQTRNRAQGEKFGALLYVESVNNRPADEARRRPVFEHMTPVFPYERIRLERPGGTTSARIVDLICPIGRGQRGMIVSPPKAGKTTLLKDIAKSILFKDPDANVIILLIDERPEEVTDMKESVTGTNVEIIYSTFDELPDHHRRVSEMVIERAKRLVEQKEDVVILLDSITRLARAYNVLVPPSGRTLSGGLDPTALYMPKRFFGAARKMREGGSLTILATALVDTGSKMDDVVYEEFKGTGNMELILDRKLQERRIFPAIDIVKSGTRREDLLLTSDELEAVNVMRRSLNGARAEEATEAILNAFAHLKTNQMVVETILQRKVF